MFLPQNGGLVPWAIWAMCPINRDWMEWWHEPSVQENTHNRPSMLVEGAGIQPTKRVLRLTCPIISSAYGTVRSLDLMDFMDICMIPPRGHMNLSVHFIFNCGQYIPHNISHQAISTSQPHFHSCLRTLRWNIRKCLLYEGSDIVSVKMQQARGPKFIWVMRLDTNQSVNH